MAHPPLTYHVPPEPTPLGRSPWLRLLITALPTGIGMAAWIGFFSLRRSRALNHVLLPLLILSLTAATIGLLVLWAHRARLRTGITLHLLGLLVGAIGYPALVALRTDPTPPPTLAWVSAAGLGMYYLTWDIIAVSSVAAVVAAASCWWCSAPPNLVHAEWDVP